MFNGFANPSAVMLNLTHNLVFTVITQPLHGFETGLTERTGPEIFKKKLHIRALLCNFRTTSPPDPHEGGHRWHQIISQDGCPYLC